MEFFDSLPMHWLAVTTLYESLKDMRQLPAVLCRGYGYADGLFAPGKWDNPDFGFTVDVPVALSDRLNKRFTASWAQAKTFKPRITFEVRTALLVLARLATIVLFWTRDLTVPQMIAVLAVQQLAISPLSLVPSFAWSLTDADLRVSHHLVFAVLSAVWYTLVPPEWADMLSLTISFEFCVGYFFLDLGVCAYLTLFGKSTANRAVVPSLKALATSVVWGSLTSRTYPFVLCALMHGTKVNFALLAIDAALSATLRCAALVESVTKISPFSIQYVAHRLIHLPNFYDHGHRTHHGILESKMVTAFESSFAFGGIGMAEEFGPLMTDVGLHLLLGTQSNHFNIGGLISAWFVKETHTDFADDADGQNMHMLHHQNAGIQYASPWQDIVFGTAGTNNQFISYGKRLTREKITEGVDEPMYRITMRRETPLEKAERLASRSLPGAKRHVV